MITSIHKVGTAGWGNIGKKLWVKMSPKKRKRVAELRRANKSFEVTQTDRGITITEL